MSRLTNKDLVYIGRMNGKTLFDKVYNKLGQIEDIEDELGCPLEVIFKALKDGIVVDNKTRWHTTVSLINVKLDNNYYFSIGDYPLYKLKDYRKTWWLTEDLGE